MAKAKKKRPAKHRNNPPRAPKGWMKATRVRVVRKGGREILEVQKPRRKKRR